MNITTWTKPKSYFLFILGSIILFTPAWFFGLFGLDLGDAGIVVSRMYAAAFFPVALTLLKVSSVEDFSSNDAIYQMLGDSVAFVVLLMAQLTGLMNTFGWILVLATFLSASGFFWCYLQIKRSSTN